MRMLQAHDWPGNVREIRNVVERLMIMVPEDEILPQHLHVRAAEPPAAWSGELTTLKEARERFERRYVEHVLDAYGGNMSQAARILGLERSHFYRKLRSLRIDRSPAPR
jgi:two-component system nitrogen regulation response regulator NtrX